MDCWMDGWLRAHVETEQQHNERSFYLLEKLFWNVCVAFVTVAFA